MRIFKWIAAFAVATFCSMTAASAGVQINVDMTSQSMHVTSDSGESYDWPVSTAGRGYMTPHGTYTIKNMETMHRSRKYHNSPMPYSMFFSGGFAIHGTNAERNLGRAASHGCVRLSRANAATLFALVKKEGKARVNLTGQPPLNVQLAVDGHHKKHMTVASRHHHRNVMVASAHHHHAPLAYAPQQHPKSLFQWLSSPGLN